MKVGTLAYATDSGLGVLAKAFYDHGIVNRVLRVKHPHYRNHPEWYDERGEVHYRDMHPLGKTREYAKTVAREFLSKLDVAIFFETPFDWTLLDFCAGCCVKTVVMPMHEYSPEKWPAQPDLILNVSDLEQRLYPCLQGCSECGGTGAVETTTWANQEYRTYRACSHASVRINVPVEVPHRRRSLALNFVHNSGHGGVNGRNGTKELLEALPLIQSPITLTVRSQVPLLLGSVSKLEGWVNLSQHNSMERFKDGSFLRKVYYYNQTKRQCLWLEIGDTPYERLWDQGDAFVFPERFNGLSLPLQEARAAGMLVMSTNRFPINTWLPQQALIPYHVQRQTRVSSFHQPFDEAMVNAKDVAETIDAWYGKDISEYSDAGRQWAEQNSWAALGPKYREILERL